MTNLILELLTRAWKLVFNHELFKTALERKVSTLALAHLFSGLDLLTHHKADLHSPPQGFLYLFGLLGFRVTLIHVMENGYSYPSTNRP